MRERLIRRGLFAAVTGCGAAGYAAALALAAGGDDVQGREASAREALAALERSSARSAAHVYGSEAFCTGSPPDAAAALSARVSTVAAAVGLNVREAKTAPRDAGAATTVVAEGEHRRVMEFLAALAQGEPTVFVGRLALEPVRDGVRLSLEGEVACSV